MKFNFVESFLALAISLLLAYGFFSFKNGENNLLLFIGSSVLLANTLIIALSSHINEPRTTTNIRFASFLFFFTAMMSNIFFTRFQFTNSFYLVVNGILFFSFNLIVYFLFKTRQ